MIIPIIAYKITFFLKKDFLRLFSRCADGFPHSLSHILTVIVGKRTRLGMKREK